MPQLGPLEILVIFVVALLVFGPSKLPEIGRQVGRGVNEFRKFQHSLRQDFDGMFGGHDDQSDAATDAPTLPPKDVATGDAMTGAVETIDVDSTISDAAISDSTISDTGSPQAANRESASPDSVEDEPGDPMLPLPWPDAVPPPPPPPDDSAPADRTP